MPSEYALVGLVHLMTPDKRMSYPSDASLLLTTRRKRARLLRIVTRRAFRRVARLLRLWRRRMTESNELWAMSDRELRDFGISRYDAEHEAKKAIWKASLERW
jgi:uncharacterized protein YjiS (DUF1127 family)